MEVEWPAPNAVGSALCRYTKRLFATTCRLSCPSDASRAASRAEFQVTFWTSVIRPISHSPNKTSRRNGRQMANSAAAAPRRGLDLRPEQLPGPFFTGIGFSPTKAPNRISLRAQHHSQPVEKTIRNGFFALLFKGDQTHRKGICENTA